MLVIYPKGGGQMKKLMNILFPVILVVATVAAIFLTSQSGFKEPEPIGIIIGKLDLEAIPDGEYVGDAEYNQITAKVKVTVSNSKIASVEVLEHICTKGHNAEDIIETVIANQSLQVDVVTKATLSSEVMLKAIENALTQ